MKARARNIIGPSALVGALIGGAGLWSCAEAPQAASAPAAEAAPVDGDVALARVFERRITVEDYRRRTAGVPERLKGQVEPRRYLQAMIDEELLVREAERRNLHRSAELLEARQKEARVLTLRQLYQLEGIETPQPDEEALRAYFATSPYNRRVRFSLLMVRDKQRVAPLMDSIAAGADFEALSIRHSQDSRILERDADMGYHRWGETMPSHEALTRQAFTMQSGQLAGPLKVADGYFLLKVTDVHPVSFEQERDAVQQAYMQEKLAAQLGAYYERLAQRYGLTVEPAGLRVLAAALEDSAAADASRLVATYGEGARLDVGQCRRLLLDSGLPPSGGEADSLRRPLLRQIAREVLTPQEIGRLGLMQSEFISRQWQKSRRKFLVQALKKQIVAQVPPANENVLRLFFDENQARYAEQEQVEVKRLTVADATQGRAWVERLRAGATVPQWEAGAVELTYSSAAMAGDHPVSRALRAEPGTYHGPFATDTGHIVLYIKRRIDARQPAFETVRPQVAEDFAARQAEDRFIEFVKSLRQRDAAQIEFYEEPLGRLATPVAAGGADG